MCEEIRRYTARNPVSADDCEGIRKWWLPPDLREAATAAVIEALARLVAEGHLTRRRMPDGRVVYASTAGGGGPLH